MWLYVETSINMKFSNMNDKWNKNLVQLHNLNTKHKKIIYKQMTCAHDERCEKNINLVT